MARYIDADELRRRVKEKTNPYGKPTLDYESGVKVLNMIDNAPAADVAPRAEWISAEERLPETEGWYFVWDDVQETVKKRFFYRIPQNFPVETYPHIREYFGNVSDYKRFTHWMPLPEPPKGE